MKSIDFLVIGSGPAGLAAGAVLSKNLKQYVLLEKENEIAPSWKNHYDRLHLHTPKKSSYLPYQKFPKNYPRYPSRDQLVKYLENYCLRFNIKPTFNSEVTDIQKEEKEWIVRTKIDNWKCKYLIIATGLNHIPYSPSFLGIDSFPGKIIHSHEYKNAQSFSGKRVLVVGMGNSGSEIALDLANTAKSVSLCVRGPINIFPRDTLGISSVTLSILMRHFPAKMVDASSNILHRSRFKKLEQRGLTFRKEGPRSQIENSGKTPVIDIGTSQLIIDGKIKVLPQITSIVKDCIKFENGIEETFDSVVFATGYRPALDFLMKELSSVPEVSGRPGDINNLPNNVSLIGFKNPPFGTLYQIRKDALSLEKYIKSI